MRLMAELGAAYGMPVAAALKGTGVRERELADPAALVHPEQELQLIRNLLTRLDAVPALGVHAGLRYHYTAFGMLGFAWVSSPNLRSALDFALCYFSLTFAFTSFHVTDTAAHTLVTVDDSEVPDDLKRFIVERDSAALIQVQRDLYPAHSVISSVLFPFPQPADASPYEAALGLRPIFGQPPCAIKFDRSALLRPLPLANEGARSAAEEQCRLLLDRRKCRSGLSLKIRDRLIRDSARMPGMAAVAADLCMTSRTLRRRLSDEGTTFSAVRDEVRLALAEEFLSMTSLTIEQIAVRLGYAEPTCFINAFKGWKGVTPLVFRKGAQPAGKRMRN
jgi:AraC-like DNA-binding protein